MNKEKLAQIEQRVAEIKRSIAEIGNMRPGSLSIQYRDPENQQGAFYQLSYTHNMKSKTEHIREEFVQDIRRQVDNYKKHKELNAEWIALSIEHSRLTMGHKSNDQIAVKPAPKLTKGKARTRHS